MKYLFLWGAVGWAGCANGFRPEDYPEPQQLFGVSDQMFRRGNCADAILGFRRIAFQVPARDDLGVRARFLMAECHFSMREYLEASRQFRRVVDDSPDHALAANALLRAGDAQMQLWKRPELDPTYGEAALATFQELIARFPGTTTASRAAVRLRGLGEWFAEKEFKNGEFYYRLKAYDSAILYYRDVVARFGSSEHATRALLRLVDIYGRLEYGEERKEICDHLRQFYPDTEGVEKGCQDIGTGA